MTHLGVGVNASDDSMIIKPEQLETWMVSPEGERLEFKEAKSAFSFDNLAKYCSALANEGGGRIILGVTNKRPRRVVGTSAFPDSGRTKADLYRDLNIRVHVYEVHHPGGRVLVFDVPNHPIGLPVSYKGQFLMRAGEDLLPMSSPRLKAIIDEVMIDFSAEYCDDASFDDLDPAAIELFRERWRQKSGNVAFDHVGQHQLLADAELVADGRVTYAALILFGTKTALGKHLPQAEVIFEYRNSEASSSSQQRNEFREGFFRFHDELWEIIDRRNDVFPYQRGFFVRDIPTFRERVVREAVLNAICHRDYRLSGSIFVRQFPMKLDIVSPGGFPPGITEENILTRQLPRNRRLAEALTKCGLVERAGQGVDLMFEETIREGKLPPDFIGTDHYQVWLTLWGEVRDAGFLRFLERIGQEIQTVFTTEDLIILDLVHREQPVAERLRSRLQRLRDLGIVENQGRGRGVHYFLSRRFYSFVGQPGIYTRRRGLDRETNKSLLLRHIQDSRDSGAKLSELLQVLPNLNERTVRGLLQEMKAEGLIQVIGRTNAARWFPV